MLFFRSNPDGYGVAPHCLDPGTVEHITGENFDGQNWEQQIETSDIRSRSKEWPRIIHNTYLWLFLNLGVFFAAQKKIIFLILWHYPGNTCICNKFFYNREYILVYTSIWQANYLAGPTSNMQNISGSPTWWK